MALTPLLKQALALELSNGGRAAARNIFTFAGYRSKVLSHAAAAVAGENRVRAETLIEQAINDAKQSLYGWLKAEALLEAADALATWDGDRADRLLREALELARAEQAESQAARTIARAATVSRRQARALVEEAIAALEKKPDYDLLEAIARALTDLPETLSATLAPRIVNAVLNGEGIMLKRLTLIIPLLIRVGKTKTMPANTFIEEFDTAVELIEELFIG